MKYTFLFRTLLVVSILAFWACGDKDEDKGNDPGPDIASLPQFDTSNPASQSYVKEVVPSGGSSGGSSTAQVVSTLTGRAGLCADAHGHVWSTAQQQPTLTDSEGKSTLGKYCGDTLLVFESRLSGLVPGKTYFVRPYATYAQQTVYGKAFTVTLDVKAPVFPPRILLNAIPEITANQLKIGVYIEGNGGGDIQQHGFAYLEGTTNDMQSMPVFTPEDTKFLFAESSPDYPALKLGPYTGSLPGLISATLTGLKPNTNYKVWAFASNAGGISFTQSPFIFKTLER